MASQNMRLNHRFPATIVYTCLFFGGDVPSVCPFDLIAEAEAEAVGYFCVFARRVRKANLIVYTIVLFIWRIFFISKWNFLQLRCRNTIWAFSIRYGCVRTGKKTTMLNIWFNLFLLLKSVSFQWNCKYLTRYHWFMISLNAFDEWHSEAQKLNR